MEWKMFGKKGKLGTAKQKVFQVLKLISGLEREDSDISLPSPVFTVAPHEQVHSSANHSLEAELKKAEALAYARMLLNKPK